MYSSLQHKSGRLSNKKGGLNWEEEGKGDLKRNTFWTYPTAATSPHYVAYKIQLINSLKNTLSIESLKTENCMNATELTTLLSTTGNKILSLSFSSAEIMFSPATAVHGSSGKLTYEKTQTVKH